MPLLQYGVSSPAANAVVGRRVTVSGFARVVKANSGNLIEIDINGVDVQFGTGGAVVQATFSGSNWTATSDLPSTIVGNSPLHLTATLHAANRFNISTIPNESEPGPPVPFDEVQSVDVTVGLSAAPAFSITAPSGGTVLPLGDGGGRVGVDLSLAGGQFYPLWVSITADGQPFSKEEVDSGSTYHKDVQIGAMPLGTRTISVTVENKDRVSSPQTCNVTVTDIGLPQVVVTYPRESPQNLVWDGTQDLSLAMTGTAADLQSGMVGDKAAVTWALSATGSRKTATPRAAKDFSGWSALVPLNGFGAHSIFVWATDAAGNVAGPLQRTVNLISSYTPLTLDERLNQREYLASLLSFAQEQINLPTSPATPLDTATLVAALGQPVDKLSQPLSAAVDQGGREVNELRVPVELLRGYIKATSTPSVADILEATYRTTAYDSLLASAGTSYQELRIARGAPQADRLALARRLGVRLATTRPDALDRLVLDSTGNGLNEAALESMFGLPATTAGLDPLRVPAVPQLLAWQQSGLKLTWSDQDQHPNAPRVFQVLADPDLISASDVISSVAGDPIRTLLNSRINALRAFLTSLDAARNAAANPTSALAALQNLALPAGLDLAALETQSEQGVDITPALAAAGLDNAGFRLLRLTARLADGGTVTLPEWADVEGVLTTAYKKRVLYPTWRTQESGFVLSPDFFVLSDVLPKIVNSYRFDSATRSGWQSVLRTRIAELQALADGNTQAVADAEKAALPILRDALISDVTAVVGHPAADDLTALFRVDMSANGTLRTTRLEQGIESVQSLLWAKRAGKLPTGHPAAAWVLSDFAGFTAAWRWMGEHASWQSATTAFLFPERNLDPSLLVPASGPLTTLFKALRDAASGSGTLSVSGAKFMTDNYLRTVGMTVSYFDPAAYRSAAHQRALQAVSKNTAAAANREIFWAVPMLMAQQLHAVGDYQAALDWYWLVYPFDVDWLSHQADSAYPVSIYNRIDTETVTPPNLAFPTAWTTALDPFALVENRPIAPYTRYTLLSIIRCHLDYADAEFTRETDESVAHARSLYVTARDLLGAAALVPQTPTNPGESTLAIPDLTVLRNRAQVQLAKIRQGRNIAGIPRPKGLGPISVVQPTPYRFKVLLQRAQQLAAQAEQMEAGYLAALEKYDAGNLRIFDAQKGIELTATQLGVAASKVAEANDAVAAAQAQRNKAATMARTYATMIAAPPNQYEQNLLGEYSTARDIKDGISVANTTIGVLQASAQASDLFGFVSSAGAKQVVAGSIAAATAVRGVLEIALNHVEAQEQANSLKAGIEQRRQEWRVQQTSAEQDAMVAAAQVVVANDQVTIATGELTVAQQQSDQAAATLTFLSTQFTNPDLYLWMSTTLGGVYRYFLQQATATARLAQAQLAFERAEPPRALIRTDYWQTPAELTSNAAQPDRRGLTGAEQLTQDLAQLDQYAFGTDRRRLNLSQTFSLARLMPVEFLDFRRTGVLPFATPMRLFDADFPGHYLRLIRQVRTSLVALVPTDRGIRATLYANGISRVTTGSDGTFTDVVVRSDPGAVALTSPVSATGVFDLDVQSDLLLPFEGSGVDTTWELQLPPAANPFDYSGIVDVLVTIDYTALSDNDYREQVVTALNADRDRGADCVFSLARDFPDQWYDLNNPADRTAVRTVTLPLRDIDFPYGIDQLSTAAVTVRLAAATASTIPDGVLTLGHANGGGDATAVNGLASTRRGAAAWVTLIGTSPVGDWLLTLPPATAALLDAGTVNDVLLMLSWTGQAPAWTS